MNVLIPCSHCDRYVRSQEESCPFCGGALAVSPARPVARALVRSPSRAAAFALRTALVVAPAALACGDGMLERDVDASAGSGGGGQASAAGAGGSAQGSAGEGSGGGDALARDDEPDAGASDAGFVPVPIYGGVFPDPVTRARV